MVRVKLISSKFLSPFYLAIILAVVLALWLIQGDHKSALAVAPDDAPPGEKEHSRVEVRRSSAREHKQEVILQGFLKPWQSVQLIARVSGRVESLLVHQGNPIKGGEALLVLSDEGRTERLREARATVRLRQSELDSSKTLKKSQFTTETELNRLSSALAQSKADLVAAQLAIKNSRPTAPFTGVFDRRYVELGEWVNTGARLADVVDISKLKVVADIPQQEVSRVQIGQLASVELLDGRNLEAKVSFVSYSANSETRSFYVELVTQNPELLHLAGASATVRIHLSPVMAHSFSPALLSLNDIGDLGVYAVNNQNQVAFHPVNILKVGNQQAVVSNLPEQLRIITLGAGFVSAGQTVTAVEAEQ